MFNFFEKEKNVRFSKREKHVCVRCGVKLVAVYYVFKDKVSRGLKIRKEAIIG